MFTYLFELNFTFCYVALYTRFSFFFDILLLHFFALANRPVKESVAKNLHQAY